MSRTALGSPSSRTFSASLTLARQVHAASTKARRARQMPASMTFVRRAASRTLFKNRAEEGHHLRRCIEAAHIPDLGREDNC